MPGLQSEQFTLFCPTSVDDNFLKRSFCTETQPIRIGSERPLGEFVQKPNPEELAASNLWASLSQRNPTDDLESFRLYNNNMT
jgi:hypothetical protein